MTVVRILIWNLADSKTSLDELREQLPDLADGDLWIANASQERFGLVSSSDAPPDLQRVRELLGVEPAVAEEYDQL